MFVLCGVSSDHATFDSDRISHMVDDTKVTNSLADESRHVCNETHVCYGCKP